MSQDKKRFRRRDLIKASGLSLVGLGATTTASAKTEDDFRETIERSHRVKQATDSVELWLDYLENYGIYGTTVQHSYSIPKGVGTQEVSDKSDLDINISLVYDCDIDSYYSELTWTYNGGYGENPLDIVALFYDETWWKLTYDTISKTTSTSSYVEPEEGWGFDFEGPGYSMDDDSAYWNSDWDSRHWAGVYIQPRDDDVASEDREIQGEYQHTWKDITIDSVSVSFPAGISASFSDNEYTWSTKTEDDGDTLLRLSEDDATLQNCGGIQ